MTVIFGPARHSENPKKGRKLQNTDVKGRWTYLLVLGATLSAVVPDHATDSSWATPQIRNFQPRAISARKFSELVIRILTRIESLKYH